MTTPVAQMFDDASRERFALASGYVNSAFVRVLKLTGIARRYVRAEGAYLFDDEGNRYLDCLSGYGLFNVGHNHPTVLAALADALTRRWPNMVQMDAPPLSGAAARALIERATPGLGQVYFGHSGADAVEAAMKFARRATGRARLLAVRNGYHGLTYGALSLCGRPDLWHERFGPVVPACGLVPLDDLEALEEALSSRDVAAFFIEPVQGEAGAIVPRDGYLEAAQALCRRYGTLFVLDEVQTGVGRTGTFLAGSQWGLEPDIVCLAKALSGGVVPVSATLARKAVFRKVFDRIDHAVIHNSTFGEDNLAMVAILATLHVLEEERAIENCARVGGMLIHRLRRLARRHPVISRVTGRGLLVGVHFESTRGARSGWTAQRVATALMKGHRILIQPAGHDPQVLKITPPLNVSEAEIDGVVSALDSVLSAFGRAGRVALPSAPTLAERV